MLFEIEGRERLLPMEGMRGLAVTLVFLQHYCRQFAEAAPPPGFTGWVTSFFRSYGNCGVELFFVLSGFLIYGMLLRKRRPFVSFMARRGRRIYPAFLAAFALGAIVDLSRPAPLIPHDPAAGFWYVAANLFLLPGLLPIMPVSAVNWSLSYEWWFYAACTFLFATLRLVTLPALARVSVIIGLAVLVIGLSAFAVPYVPIRGLSLLAGMLLAEMHSAKFPAASPWMAVLAIPLSAAVVLDSRAPGWLTSVVLATSFTLLCSAAFFSDGWLYRILSLSPLRWLGNISYSFYLLHGFVVVLALRILFSVAPQNMSEVIFWAALPAVFLLAFGVAACLFLAIEKPISLKSREAAAIASPEPVAS